jgi:Protein of unknown function (DUF1232)
LALLIAYLAFPLDLIPDLIIPVPGNADAQSSCLPFFAASPDTSASNRSAASPDTSASNRSAPTGAAPRTASRRCAAPPDLSPDEAAAPGPSGARGVHQPIPCSLFGALTAPGRIRAASFWAVSSGSGNAYRSPALAWITSVETARR